MAPPPSSRAGDLTIRILSAVLLGPPVLAAVWYGGWVFQALVLLAALLSVREWVRLVEPGARRLPLLLSLACVAAVVVTGMGWGCLVALWVAAAATPVLFLAVKAVRAGHAKALAFAIPYIAVACLALMWVRTETGEAGLPLFLFLLLAIWATDIGAYAAGRSIGGPKLAPRISPKKTWAGLIGGMAAAALVGYGVAALFGARLPAVGAGLAAVLAVAGQAGDLFESYVKRRRDVKDSGTLIPGHGGLLDRIDGLIVAAPLFALFHGLLGEWVQWW
ncbi:phosphatidate cytidylyltransferase [Oleisolibacter albus]|uniref:phosphatidate cytidylyltransferase n=1 Tax=Oleisolibacter albus TaxID=2171757 RepID=UPI001EFE9414|nr:phosphatidate cytidylyltransferase [Oleisolibacter albus]